MVLLTVSVSITIESLFFFTLFSRQSIFPASLASMPSIDCWMLERPLVRRAARSGPGFGAEGGGTGAVCVGWEWPSVLVGVLEVITLFFFFPVDFTGAELLSFSTRRKRRATSAEGTKKQKERTNKTTTNVRTKTEKKTNKKKTNVQLLLDGQKEDDQQTDRL